jgi:hypothetical protein
VSAAHLLAHDRRVPDRREEPVAVDHDALLGVGILRLCRIILSLVVALGVHRRSPRCCPSYAPRSGFFTVATRDSVERMNIRTARYDQLNLFLLQITAKTRELGGARAVLIAHGTAPNAGRIRLIDKTLGDLATVERMVVNEMLRRYRLGGWTHAYPVSTQRPRAPMRQLSSQTSGLVL